MANVLLRVGGVVLAAFALALLYARLPESGARVEKPLCERCNVVLVSFDTVRADHLGAYGYARATSPRVDELAARSLVFDRAIAQAPWTLPSHGSMLSGLYPRRLGVTRYPANRVLSDQYPTLAEAFRAAGYATGSFNGGGFVSEHWGFDRGFDVYESRGRRYEHNLDAAVDWVEAHKAKPFFLFLHGYDAHRPYYSKPVDKTAMGLAPNDEADQSHFCLSNDREAPDAAYLDKILRYYDASIHHGDRAIGVFLDALREMGLEGNTVVLLTSDHGDEFFEHGNCDHVRFVYRESVHVPYILHVPGLGRGGEHLDGLVPASISVPRTLLDLAGIPHAMPGVTLLPMIQGKQKGFPAVYSEADSAPGVLGSRGRVLAITKPDVKVVSYLDEGTEEAYDLRADPEEKSPLAEKHSAYLLRQTLRSWADSLRPLPRPPREPDPEAMRAADADGGESGGAKAAGAEAPAAPGEPGESGRRGGGKGNGSDGGVPKELREELKSLGYLQ